jgi:PAS domain S-box-containing protein
MPQKTTVTQAGTSVSKRSVSPDARDPELWLQFERLLTDLSARFINLPAELMDAAIGDAQRRICECLGFDQSGLWEWDVASPEDLVLSHYHRAIAGPPIPERVRASEYFPWMQKQVLANKPVILPSVEDSPEEAVTDRATWRFTGMKSTMVFPLSVGGSAPFGVVSFNTIREQRPPWSEPLIRRIQLVAQVFANAIARKRIEQALREREERLSMATEAAGAWVWKLDPQGQCFLVGTKLMELFGLPPGDKLEVEHFMALVHAEDREYVQDMMKQAMNSCELKIVEYRIVRPDGQVRWLVTRGRMFGCVSGQRLQLMGITADITGRKQGEEALRQALDEVRSLRDRLQQENVYLREQALSEAGHGTIVGESEGVRGMLALAKKVAPTDSAVLITGETGTGKELLAQAIHDLSPRKAKTMVKVNCAALPGPLIESELFGREKGAYTGAMTQRIGRFEVADGSTIFLDEIGDLPLELQVKLLRILQDGHYERLGSNRTLKTDVRVIAATNRDLKAMVKEGRFREDLFHRLNVFPIEMPPLRARVVDIPLLVWQIVQEFNTKMGRAIESIPSQTMDQLKRYAWPGNVRELRNLIERAMIMSEGHTLKIDLTAASTGSAAEPDTLEERERKHVLNVLERTHWRISGKGGAAEILGLLPTTLNSRMKKLGIARPVR